MQPSNQHCLAGKARRARDVGRSQRLYVQQLIDEYFEEHRPIESHERNIPIRRACEFLPTAEVAVSTGPDDSGAGQFEYATTVAEPITGAGSDEGSAVPLRLDQTREFPIPTIEKVAVIRPPRLGVTLPIGPEPARVSSPRGFLVGCSIGTAAALALLLLLRWLLM